MASTYSITFSITNGNVGYPPHNPFLPINHQIEDAYVPVGAKQNAMSDNTQVQVKRQDGSLRNYTIDSSRSDPSKNLIFLLPV
jgi:hypothetical protein